MTFDNIPNTRVPGQYAEFKTGVGESGLSALEYKALHIGQALTTGTKDAKEQILVSNADKAAEYFGRGSQLHLMAQAHFNNNNVTSLTAIAVQKDDVAVTTGKSVGSIKIDSAATANGTLIVYIAGERIAVIVTNGDAVGDIAANLLAEINNNHLDLPVKSSVATDTVSFEALNVGLHGDDIDIRLNYNDGEDLPLGVTVTITAMNGGATNPDISSGSPSVIDVMGDIWFQLLSMPYSDTVNIGAMETELDRRFGPLTQIDGVMFIAKSDTYSNLITFGSGENSKQICLTGQYKCPMTPCQIASATLGQVGKSLAVGNGAESRPFQTLPLVGILSPAKADQFTWTERDSLLKNGIATLKADEANVLRIERLITTYQKNESDAADISWLDVNTRFTAMFIRWDWTTNLKTKFPRFKIGDDGTRYGAGQPVITPKTAKAEAIARFELWEEAALVEDFDYFKANLIAERDGDVNAMDWFLPTNFINQFRVGKTQIGIIL